MLFEVAEAEIELGVLRGMLHTLSVRVDGLPARAPLDPVPEEGVRSPSVRLCDSRLATPCRVLDKSCPC